jgi:hypothetical protein
MRSWRTALLLLPLGAPLAAEEASRSYVQPSVSVHAVSEPAGGPAYDAPEAPVTRDLTAGVAAGVDGRVQLEHGSLGATALVFVDDALHQDARRVFGAARLRGVTALGHWRLRLDDAARGQRRGAGALADFQRNELALALEPASAFGLGLRANDRRRSVRGESALGFERQTLLASAQWARPTQLWRLEIGPQRFSADTTHGWRMVGGVEWAGRLAGWSAGLRLSWIEPTLESRGGATSSPSDLSPTMAPSTPSSPPVPQPTAVPPSIPIPAPLPPAEPTRLAPTPEAAAPTANNAPVPAPLLGVSLLVDPLEDDESDWDFGRRKQDLAVAVARSLSPSLTLTAELRLQRERGPDLLPNAASDDVERDRIAARLHLRRDFGRHWSLLAQGGWQHLRDSRPRVGYSRGLLSLGLELRP